MADYEDWKPDGNTRIDGQQAEKILSTSARDMPNNPSSQGWSAERVKRRYYEPIILLIRALNGVLGKNDVQMSSLWAALKKAISVTTNPSYPDDRKVALTLDLFGASYEIIGTKGDSGEIERVTASVDSEVGTPSVDLTVGGTPSSRTFAFAFHNLKGEKGDKGDTGDKGEKGDRGIPFVIGKVYKSTEAMNADADVADDTYCLIQPDDDQSEDYGKVYFRKNGEWTFLVDMSVGIQGPKGEKGETGATGSQGIPGPKGDKGDQGTRGYSFRQAKVDVGSDTDVPLTDIANNEGMQVGDVVLDSEGDLYTITEIKENAVHVSDALDDVSLKGPKGDAGNAGPQGLKGDKGDTGETPNIVVTATADDNIGTPSVEVTKSGTAEAPTFALAFKNIKGETGPQGPKGDKGDPATLPIASASTLGGVKIVSSSSIGINDDGTIDVKLAGNGGIFRNTDGTLTAKRATDTQFGVVLAKPATDEDTQEVHIDSTGHLITKPVITDYTQLTNKPDLSLKQDALTIKHYAYTIVEDLLIGSTIAIKEIGIDMTMYGKVMMISWSVKPYAGATLTTGNKLSFKMSTFDPEGWENSHMRHAGIQPFTDIHTDLRPNNSSSGNRYIQAVVKGSSANEMEPVFELRFSMGDTMMDYQFLGHTTYIMQK